MNGFVAEEDNNMELLEVDNTAVRENQISRIQAVKATRDQTSVDAALKELADCAAGGERESAGSCRAGRQGKGLHLARSLMPWNHHSVAIPLTYRQ